MKSLILAQPSKWSLKCFHHSGQNLTDRCLSLDSSSQETFPITVEGVNEVASKAANMSTGATVNLVKCYEESSSSAVVFGTPQVLLLALFAFVEPSLLFRTLTILF